MRQSEELRVEEFNFGEQFTKNIENDVIIISYIGLENEQITTNYTTREDYSMLVNDHNFNQDGKR